MQQAGWRCFPWDRTAGAGQDGSATYLVPTQRDGRFDLHGNPPVLYLAETPAHAVAEVLQGFRGNPFADTMLRRRGHPLALAEFRAAPDSLDLVADLTAPSTLLRLRIGPDQLASHHRTVTQAISRHVHQSGASGLRWWSSLTGNWHATILFMDRWPRGALAAEPPALLTADHPAVIEAREFLRLG